jgi:hypothetical protein
MANSWIQKIFFKLDENESKKAFATMKKLGAAIGDGFSKVFSPNSGLIKNIMAQLNFVYNYARKENDRMFNDLQRKVNLLKNVGDKARNEQELADSYETSTSQIYLYKKLLSNANISDAAGEQWLSQMQDAIGRQRTYDETGEGEDLGLSDVIKAYSKTDKDGITTTDTVGAFLNLMQESKGMSAIEKNKVFDTMGFTGMNRANAKRFQGSDLSGSWESGRNSIGPEKLLSNEAITEQAALKSRAENNVLNAELYGKEIEQRKKYVADYMSQQEQLTAINKEFSDLNQVFSYKFTESLLKNMTNLDQTFNTIDIAIWSAKAIAFDSTLNALGSEDLKNNAEKFAVLLEQLTKVLEGFIAGQVGGFWDKTKTVWNRITGKDDTTEIGLGPATLEQQTKTAKKNAEILNTGNALQKANLTGENTNQTTYHYSYDKATNQLTEIKEEVRNNNLIITKE